ncbi:hypothetical protein CcaverHIS002_0106330 [Cutaneotrichosporon cavernicola]|uniref:Uncharacterized protein n=1 Tax=Cutaneotrichosporon cavernicola TaxID=279322 RepID=A0AA48HYL0_9TREE|nr:uncharacterized protein CcaverHIS019_0106270 [Cutaneotrichosporon cavernicola]BEI80104.1 hypothetical protein CcaverHIS002_0106330 [Cutaneotrichosporon cavernicola]BEI87909.1 hypothetical protein CcaverHIS019_0106270 [Cutaneotrichosporon cavernicola]BEI95683.1 hypothetical protein CcaverHIS631_0106320 [Cutaneotrichosporon cavernicola]BEJ03457.1 hypothetical protein CcaverHIS641_0106320 [Cutaneotrichosporon cavernicola]
MSQYQHVPTSEVAALENEEELSLQNPLSRATINEFNRPEPHWLKRLALIGAILLLGWFSVYVGTVHIFNKPKEPEVIYATRYSDEFRYRPAASPVITEYLKDGRIRLRGATPGGVGVREEDQPQSPGAKAAREAKMIKEAEEKALEQLKESKRKAKERARKRKLREIRDRAKRAQEGL